MTTLNELLDQLQAVGLIPENQIKYYRYNVRRYSKDVMGYATLHEAFVKDCYLPVAERDALITLKLREDSAHVRRNVRNAMKLVFDRAREQGIWKTSLLTPQSAAIVTACPPTPKGQGARPPSLPSSKQYRRDAYRFRVQDWPAAAQEDFADWKRKVRQPEASAQAQQCLRLTTVNNYQTKFESFFGYCRNVRGLSEISLRQVIDVTLQKDFVEWHSVERNGYRTKAGCLTRSARQELTCAKMVARHYYQDEQAVVGLTALQNSYAKAPPTFNKRDRISGVFYQDLLRITELEYPKCQPPQQSSGARTAIRAMSAISNLFLVQAPARGQNYREAILGEHIKRMDDPSKKAGGYWMTNFRGDDETAALKIALDAQGQVNTYQIKISDEYTHLIDDYVNVWRPLLVKQAKQDCGNFFLNEAGKGYGLTHFTQMIEKLTYKWLGKAIPPHSYRHIVASEFVNVRNDPATAAILLNDRIETVYKNYYIPDIARAERARDEYIQELSAAGGKNSLTNLAPEAIENAVSKVIVLQACSLIPEDLLQALRKSLSAGGKNNRGS